MKKVILLLLVGIGFGFVASAQTQADTTIVFNTTVHDFGDIVQGSGPQTYRFEFTNVGPDAIIILQVQPSCGCTTSGYTKEPIAPGHKGEVVATYSPGAAVPFDKILTVRTSGHPSTVVLRVKGVVVPKPVE
jgi:hypothetical protein